MMFASLEHEPKQGEEFCFVASGDKIVTDNLGQIELQANDFTIHLLDSLRYVRLLMIYLIVKK